MIRKASTDDIPLIRSMAETVFRKTYHDILSPEQMEYMMEMMYSEKSLKEQMTTGGNTFFVEEGMGYVSYRQDRIESNGTQVFHLEKLYVMPEYQKSGVGKKFFKKIIEQMPSGKLWRIELNVNRNNNAVSFYQHLGMTVQRSGDFPIGGGFYMNDYIMELNSTVRIQADSTMQRK